MPRKPHNVSLCLVGSGCFLFFSVVRFHASNLLDPLLISVAVVKLISAVGKVVFACLFCFTVVRPLFIIASSEPRFYPSKPPGDRSLEVKATEPPTTLSSLLSIVITINIIRMKTRVKFTQNEENGIEWIKINPFILIVTEKY